MMGKSYRELVQEARVEVLAAKQNLHEAIRAWEAALTQLHPATLLLQAAERRIEKANALLRSAADGENHNSP